MRDLFSKEVLLSIRETVSLQNQHDRAKKALFALPEFAGLLKDVIVAAPYLIFIYILIAGIDIQHRILGTMDPETILMSAFVTFGLLSVANALTYVETYNTHTSGNRITNPGWYATRRVLRLGGVVTLSSCIIIVGLFMFIIPGLYFAIRLSLASPACIIDDLGIRESMFHSIEATRGQYTMLYTVFGIFGFLFLPLFLLLLLTTAWAEITIVLIFFGIVPPLLHMSLALLYINGTSEDLSFY